MSSVEIVEVINAMREPGRAELRHDNFMAKLVGHPGINALNFQGVYFDPKGEQRPRYYLPKREAELMVMSEWKPQAAPSIAGSADEGFPALRGVRPLSRPSGSL